MISVNFTILIFTLSFVVFLGLMVLVFFRPISRLIKKREENLNTDKEKAASLWEKIESLVKQYETDSVIVKTKEEASQLINKARDEANDLRQKTINKAAEEFSKKIDMELATLEKEKNELIKNLRIPVEEITHSIIHRILGQDTKVSLDFLAEVT